RTPRERNLCRQKNFRDNRIMDQANAVIIGGGVIGCAIARALSARWDDVFVLEAMPRVGMGASTRNSGVIHAGLYYPPGSLKARHCLRGNRLTYEFCAAHGVPHRNTGKLVVAVNDSQERDLVALMDNAQKNGVEGLRIIDRAAIREREPHIEAVQAIDVPSSGIVSSEELVKAYARIATGQGAHIVTNAKVERIEIGKGSGRVSSAAGEIEARCVVNSAGLFADEVAAMMGSSLARHRIYPVRGEYCEVVRAKSDLIKGLVYPVPPSSGLSLGEHLTKTLWGTVLVGPTARYIEDKNDYARDREPLEDFARNAQAMLPELQASDLVQAYSGIRAKLVPRDQHGIADFIIQRDPDLPNVIQLIGMDSPGLTSAPAIAEQVLGMAAEILG
ncbi:MAG TPA: NAD(P)/FAD-dependent oxidoreductase, partial [Candidatus Acidoferrales bacterium]|nr:NAD(P)/FAD-dependent oxidoreductase [Candidatus Acidoferrales bacterium]